MFTLHNTKNIAYHIAEVLIFYADQLVVMGSSKNSRVFYFAILLKSQKFDAREIYMVYSNGDKDDQRQISLCNVNWFVTVDLKRVW